MKRPARASDAPSLLSCLRSATADHHARVDRLIDLERLHLRPWRGQVLQAIGCFLSGWQVEMRRAAPQTLADWADTALRSERLAGDLRELGLAPAAYRVPPLGLGGAAAAWGSLYVMEGSALGGQVIASRLAAAGETTALAYFRGAGAATGARWQAFRAMLADQLDPAPPLEAAAACAAACATFDALAAVLRQAHAAHVLEAAS